MKRILHVVNIYFVIPYFLGDQLIYFTKRGYKEYIICSPSEEIYEYSKSHNFNYKEIPILRSISFWRDLKAIWEICKYIKKEEIDIVVGGSISYVGIFCYAYSYTYLFSSWIGV